MQNSISKESYFVFSGGEVHRTVNPSHSHIVMKDYTMNGFMALAETVEVMRRLGQKTIDVSYPYLPYARQDRVMEKLEPFSLKIFCKLLNSLKLDLVWIFDPHSDVGPALINNCHVTPQWEIAKRIIPQEYFDNAMFISPDAGAYKKVSKLISDDSRIAIGVKNRKDYPYRSVFATIFSGQSLHYCRRYLRWGSYLHRIGQSFKKRRRF